MARMLVTGGAGFIGSHIVDRLVGLGHEVSVIDDLSSGSLENLTGSAELIRFVRGDIAEPSDLHRVMSGMEYVFHQAALPSVPRSIEDPWSTNRVNINGTLSVLLASRNSGVKRVVYASSSSVYGLDTTLPKRESIPAHPRSPYALSKLAAEQYCMMFTDIYGLETVSLRYFNVFGARQNPHSQYAAVIPRFITSLATGESPLIYSDGEQTRDFTHVDNVVTANILACFAPGASGKVFNIGCGQRISVNELLSRIQTLMNRRINPRYTSPRPGDVPHSHADIRLAAEYLGYRPEVTVDEGLARTVAYYRKMV